MDRHSIAQVQHFLLHGALHDARSTLQLTATHCNTLQQHCNRQQCTDTLSRKYSNFSWIVRSTMRAAHCNSLQHTATHCNTLQQHCNRLQWTDTLSCKYSTFSWIVRYTMRAPHCNTLQHTATHCNHTATGCNGPTLSRASTAISLG